MEPFANISPPYNDSSENTEDDSDVLKDINRNKAELLVPAILYTVTTMVLGALGNPIAIYIYGWKWQSTTTRVFLFWLAVIDLINCLITMPTEIYVMTNFYHFPHAGFCRLSRFITYVINNSTAAIFIAIAIDRYMRICHPHRSSVSIFWAHLMCVFSLCIGAGVSWPALILYGNKSVPLPTPKSKKGFVLGVICDVKNEMDDTPYPFAFFIYLWCGFIVCVLMLCIVYILIGRVMLKRRSKKKRKEETEISHLNQNADGEEKNEGNELTKALEEPNSGDTKCAAIQMATTNWRKTRIRPPRSTLMLFALTAVFVVTFLPFLIIMTVRQHVGISFYPSLSPGEQVMVNLFSRSYLVNNCANPIVYGMCNSQFRDHVKKLFSVTTRSRECSLSREESGVSRGFSC